MKFPKLKPNPGPALYVVGGLVLVGVGYLGWKAYEKSSKTRGCSKVYPSQTYKGETFRVMRCRAPSAIGKGSSSSEDYQLNFRVGSDWVLPHERFHTALLGFSTQEQAEQGAKNLIDGKDPFAS